MQPRSPRTRFTGPALIRLLDQLSALDVPASRQGFAERLGQWLKWTDAIPLSAALNASPAPASGSARGAHRAAHGAAADVQRVREALAHAIGSEPALTAGRKPQTSAASRAAAFDMPTDFPAFRRLYLAKQQLMDTAIAPLRERLRESLAATSPDMARLAALDAVMERVIGTQEHSLLATIPALLEKHWRRLREARAADAGPDASDATLAVFGQDLRAVLLAELELRLQPAQGLLAALHARPTAPG